MVPGSALSLGLFKVRLGIGIQSSVSGSSLFIEDLGIKSWALEVSLGLLRLGRALSVEIGELGPRTRNLGFNRHSKTQSFMLLAR